MRKLVLNQSVNFSECTINADAEVLEVKGTLYVPVCKTAELAESLTPAIEMPTYPGSITMADVYTDPDNDEYNWLTTKVAKLYKKIANGTIVPLTQAKKTARIALEDIKKLCPQVDEAAMLPELKWIKDNYSKFEGGYVDEWMCNVWGLLNYSEDDVTAAPKPTEVDDSFPYKVNDVLNYDGVIMTITQIKGSQVTLVDEEGESITKKKATVLKKVTEIEDDDIEVAEAAEEEPAEAPAKPSKKKGKK